MLKGAILSQGLCVPARSDSLNVFLWCLTRNHFESLTHSCDLQCGVTVLAPVLPLRTDAWQLCVTLTLAADKLCPRPHGLVICLLQTCASGVQSRVDETEFGARYLKDVPVLQWAAHGTRENYQRLSQYQGSHGWGGVDYQSKSLFSASNLWRRSLKNIISFRGGLVSILNPSSLFIFGSYFCWNWRAAYACNCQCVYVHVFFLLFSSYQSLCSFKLKVRRQ